MIKIRRAIADNLRRSAQNGDDPLKIGRIYCESLDEVISVLENRIMGVSQTMAEDVADAIKYECCDPKKSIPMDPLYALLLSHIGIDPIVATWMAMKSGLVEIYDKNNRYCTVSIDGKKPADTGVNHTSIMIGNKTEWMQYGVIFTTQLPQTATHNIEGRLLRDVISHPVLDKHPIIILGAENENEDGCKLITDFCPVCATSQELVKAIADRSNFKE